MKDTPCTQRVMNRTAKKNSTAKPTPPPEPPAPDPPELPEDDELAGKRSCGNGRIALDSWEGAFRSEKCASRSFVDAPLLIPKKSKPAGEVRFVPIMTGTVRPG